MENLLRNLVWNGSEWEVDEIVESINEMGKPVCMLPTQTHPRSGVLFASYNSHGLGTGRKPVCVMFSGSCRFRSWHSQQVSG